MFKIYKYYVIYKITNLQTGRSYIGMHRTDNLNDGYMGSSKLLKQSIKKRGIENFKKEIIFECSNEIELSLKEAELVNDAFIKRKDTYNIGLGGTGGLKSDEHQLKRSHAGRKALSELLKNEEYYKNYCDKVSAGIKKYLETHCNGFEGKKHSEKTKEKMKNVHIGKCTGSNNGNYNTCWIYNTDLKESKQIKNNELNSYLETGWLKGRKIKF
jgi:hypothetical protein